MVFAVMPPNMIYLLLALAGVVVAAHAEAPPPVAVGTPPAPPSAVQPPKVPMPPPVAVAPPAPPVPTEPPKVPMPPTPPAAAEPPNVPIPPTPPAAAEPPKVPIPPTPPAAAEPPKVAMPPPAAPGPPVFGSPPPGMAGQPKFPAILAFGDSVVDTGNNNYIRTIIRSNFPPYGKDFAGHKATGRFSDGKISIDFLASGLGIKETVPPYLKTGLTMDDLKTGVSFASAGSGYDNSTCRTMSTMTMEKQLQLFMEYKAKVGSIPERALYLLCWGSNDIVQHFTFADGMTEPQYSDFIAQRAITYIQTLASLGARRIAVTGVPPVGCLPSQRVIAGGIRRQCATDRNQLAIMVNRKVSQEIGKLATKLGGVHIVFLDLYSVFADVIQRHQDLGFKNGKDACCGYIGLAASVLCNHASPLCSDPAQFVFWDSYHPTERAYKMVMDEMINKYFRFVH